MKKAIVWSLLIALAGPVVISACGGNKSSMQKRIDKQNKKRKRGGDTGCPIKDC